MKKEVRLIVDVAGSRETVALFEQYIIQWQIWREQQNRTRPVISAQIADHTVLTESIGADLILRVYQPFEHEESPT